MAKTKLIIFLGFILVFCSIPIEGSEFVTNTQQEYYPGTKLSLEMINLEIGSSYALLIGANQNSGDYQWDNFTAIDYSMTRTIIHFDKQSRNDNTSVLIENLLINLYKDNTLQDQIWYKLHHYTEDFRIQSYLGYIAGGLATIITLFLAYIVTKHILVPLLNR